MLVLFYFLIVIFTIIVLSVDKGRESDTNDDFSGGNLFYKYGRKISDNSIVIGVDGSHPKPLITLADGLQNYILKEINQQFAGMGNRFTADIRMITDRKMSTDQRRFVKSSIVTKRRSEITYFILVVGIGNEIVIHQYLYVKGKTKWNLTFWFVVTSPLHIWGWIISWFKKNVNIYVRLRTSFNKSSYDYIDMLTIVRGLSFLFSTKLKTFAKNEGLLTEELNFVLNQSINNSQNISISNSNRINLSSISSTANVK